MATRHHHARESVADHNRRIDQHLPVTKWKQLKSAFYALLLFMLALFAVRSDANATTVFVTTVSAMLVVYGVEVHEVEIARFVSITFAHDGHGDPGDGEEDDDP